VFWIIEKGGQAEEEEKEEGEVEEEWEIQ